MTMTMAGGVGGGRGTWNIYIYILRTQMTFVLIGISALRWEAPTFKNRGLLGVLGIFTSNKSISKKPMGRYMSFVEFCMVN